MSDTQGYRDVTGALACWDKPLVMFRREPIHCIKDGALRSLTAPISLPSSLNTNQQVRPIL